MQLAADYSRSISSALGTIVPIPDTVIRSLDGELMERRFILPLPNPRFPPTDSARGLVDGLILPASTAAGDADGTHLNTTTSTSSFIRNNPNSNRNTACPVGASVSDSHLTPDVSAIAVSRGISITSLPLPPPADHNFSKND